MLNSNDSSQSLSMDSKANGKLIKPESNLPLLITLKQWENGIQIPTAKSLA